MLSTSHVTVACREILGFPLATFKNRPGAMAAMQRKRLVCPSSEGLGACQSFPLKIPTFLDNDKTQALWEELDDLWLA